jgi:Cys-tRNA(Pro)/Cys-tRNA(Cys) deacylase
MPEASPVSQMLTAKGIPHREFRHPGNIHSLDQAAKERGQTPDQIIRSIVFRLGKGDFVMVLVAGPGQISWPELRAFLKQSRMTMADDDEVLAATRYPPGAVSPFGLTSPIRILADNGIFTPEEISIGSGMRGVTIIMKTSDLRMALGGVETGNFITRQI